MVRKGFTMIEALFSLMILSFSFVLLAIGLPSLHKVTAVRYPVEEEIALRQIRRMLLLSEDIQCSGTQLDFWYQDDWFTLLLDGNRLVRVDGYLIYMENIDSLEFREKKGCIYLYYEKNQKAKERLLVC